MAIVEISAKELSDQLQAGASFVLLDVREDWEVALAKLPNSTHIPMNTIAQNQHQLPDDTPIVVYCHHGVRSLKVAHFLQEAGFEQLYNLTGGIDAWSNEVDATVATY